MTEIIDVQNLFAPAVSTEGTLGRIAAKIGRTRRPGARSDIPAGATYLAQFAALDLARHGAESPRLDLGVVYGDGPRRDAACYQVPATPGEPRTLLRVGRVRPKASAPAWGALRDLPRVACPHLDAHAAGGRTEVLVPDARTDANLVLGQIHVLWSLLHNAAVTRLSDRMEPAAAFETARRVVRGVYRDVVRADVLGTWLMPRFRARYATAAPVLLSGAGLRAPREFMAGVGRLGHGLVREIYAINDSREVVGLRTLLRHTGTGRPHKMPLTEGWLVDFSRFFEIGSPAPQYARAIGPHVARPFAPGVEGAAGTAECLVLRDLIACTRGGLRPVRSLISRAALVEPRLFEGCFAEDETVWRTAVAEWLSDTGLGAGEIEGLAGDPPLTLFLMLEAEADTGGRTLGALGSVLMGETLAAALAAAEDASEDDPALAAARRAVFGATVPASMAGLVRFLQRHYRFPDGARLHPSEEAAAATAAGEPPARTHPGVTQMFDIHSVNRQPIGRIEVADYIELGRLVAQWATEPATRPATVAELRVQLDGIAVLPDRVKTIAFTQSSLDHLVFALPAKEVVEESLDRVTDPLGDGHYPLPQFYEDHYRPGFGPVMTPLDTLLARVADYTIAQCR